MHTKVKQARIAAFLYFIMGPPTVFALIFIPRTLIVTHDAAATAQRVLANEGLFRLGVLAELIGGAGLVLIAMALHRLLADVDRWHARLMVTFVAISVAIAYVSAAFNLGALTLFREPEFVGAFDAAQREAFGFMFLRLHLFGTQVNHMFWGLWLIPFGILVMRSRFIPRILGVLLLVNGVAFIIVCFVWVLVPAYGPVMFKVMLPAFFGEIWIALYLAIKGVDVGKLSPAVPAILES